MSFLVSIFALLAIWAAWNFFWKDSGFLPYLMSVSPRYGAKMEVGYLIVATTLALVGIFSDSTIPGALSILLSVVVAAAWLLSPNGRAWFKRTL